MRPIYSATLAALFMGQAGFAEDAPTEAPFVPYLAEVSGLSAGDHLNVRYEPTHRSDDLGDLNAGTVVEVLEHDGDDRWARIIWEEGSAYISRRYITELSPEVGKLDLTRNLECLGTEPFWTLRLFKNGNATFKALDGNPLAATLREVRGDFTVDHSKTYLTDYFSAKVDIMHCSDGMSDRTYGYGVTTVIEGRPLTGCCLQLLGQ